MRRSADGALRFRRLAVRGRSGLCNTRPRSLASAMATDRGLKSTRDSDLAACCAREERAAAGLQTPVSGWPAWRPGSGSEFHSPRIPADGAAKDRRRWRSDKTSRLVAPGGGAAGLNCGRQWLSRVLAHVRPCRHCRRRLLNCKFKISNRDASARPRRPAPRFLSAAKKAGSTSSGGQSGTGSAFGLPCRLDTECDDISSAWTACVPCECVSAR